jgi:aminopeptidase YwaD
VRANVRCMNVLRVSTIALVSVVLGTLGCGGASVPVEHPAPEGEVSAPRLFNNAAALHLRFRADRALETVADLDGYFRVRGNAGYQHAIARIREDLSRAGAGALPEENVRTLELGEVTESWTPRSAHLVLLNPDGTETPLVTIAAESDPDRACLLVNSDTLPESTFEVVTLEAVRAGASPAGRLVLGTEAPTPTLEEVVRSDAAGVIVHWLSDYHRGAEHPDAAQFGYLPDLRGTHVGFSIGAADYALLTAAAASGTARVRVAVDVLRAPSAATAIEATIPGTDASLPAIAFVAHIDEPGANDNASGVAALIALARTLVHAMDEGAITQPARSIVFVFGHEMEVSSAWIEASGIAPAAGLVFDMVGTDPQVTGAPFLIERMPDPGSIWLRAPDVHSEWGQSEVAEEELHGHFLNDTTIAAVAAIASIDGPWETRSHPYEGGSDHVSFLRRGLPGILAWHFTDDAYHTTRDRLDRVSEREMRRVASAMGAVALAMASTDLADRRELLAIVEHAAHRRLGWARSSGLAALDAGSDVATERHVVEAWGQWYRDALFSVASWGARDPQLDAEVVEAQDRIAAATREAIQALTL